MANVNRKAERQAKLDELRAQQERKNRQKNLLTVVAVVAAVVVIAVVAAYVLSQQKSAATKSAMQNAQDPSFVATLTSPDKLASQLDQVGVGTANNGPVKLSPPFDDSVDGKPRILYVGAEYCPFCGMERWPLTLALSRFGTFSGLEGTLSSSDEPKPIRNVPTVSYLKSTYTSDYVAFKPYETQDREHNDLQQLSQADQAIFAKYDGPPLTDQAGSIPFLLYGGQAGTSGATYDGQFLANGKATELAAKLSDPSSEEAKGVLGATNVITAQICTLTGQKPGDVCGSAGVKAAAAALGR